MTTFGAADSPSVVSFSSLRFRGVPQALRISCFLYLAHIVLQGKVALSELSAFFAIFFLGWAMARREVRFSFHILYYPLVVYGAATSLSALVNHVSIHPFADVMIWFKMLIFPAALILFREEPPLRELAVRAQAIFAVTIALYGLYQYFALGHRDLEHRITGPATHVMTFSGQLLPIALMLLVLSAHRRKPWLIAATFIVSFALLLTFTRSVWFGWMAGIFALLALKRPRWLLFAVPVLLLALSFMPMEFFGRLVSSFDVQQSSTLDRIRMAEGGIEIIKDHPTLGVGPANVKEIYPLYRKQDAPRFRPPHLHNNFIQLWSERGILGIAAFILLIVLFLRECARGWNGPNRQFAQAGVALTVGLVYAGLFEFNFGDTEVFYLWLELFALVVASLETPAAAALNEPSPALVAGGPAAAQARP